MQKQINLSRELVKELLSSLCEHDDQCQDTVIAAQYFAAVIGLLIANVDQPASERKELLKQINEFSEHVLKDVSDKSRPRTPPRPADPAKAFGIWKPPSA